MGSMRTIISQCCPSIHSTDQRPRWSRWTVPKRVIGDGHPPVATAATLLGGWTTLLSASSTCRLCDPMRTGKFWPLEYEIQFPLGASSKDRYYKVYKENLRLVAGGAHVPDERTTFRKWIKVKRKWKSQLRQRLSLKTDGLGQRLVRTRLPKILV